MQVNQVELVSSQADPRKAPPPLLPEFALCGRSNVGKSSLLNLLTGRKALARVSATPGKTQLVHHYLVNRSWYLCDLPGYGYAKVSQKQRDVFRKLIDTYLRMRPNLMTVFMLVDCRLEPQALDLAFARQVGEQGLPLAIVFTKTDKVGRNALNQNVARFRKAILEQWETLPPEFFTSSLDRSGREEMLNYIAEACTHFIPPVIEN